MCRLLGWVASAGASLREVLGEDSFAAFGQLSRIHADGWGLAYTDGPEVRVEKSTACAASDPVFLSRATDLLPDAGLAHLRWASPGLAVEERNSHPFRHGTAAFAHNGGIYPLDQLSTLLSPEWQARVRGTTDSEHYFLAVLAEVADGGVDVPTAVGRVVARLARDFRPSSLNAMLLTADALYVINCHDPSLPSPPPPPERTVDLLVEQVELAAPYYDLRYRRSGSSVVVASSGFAQPEGGGWQLIPNNTVLRVDRTTLAVQEHPLGIELVPAGAAAAAGSDLR
jgi:predicted glutamine amidotransferase